MAELIFSPEEQCYLIAAVEEFIESKFFHEQPEKLKSALYSSHRKLDNISALSYFTRDEYLAMGAGIVRQCINYEKLGISDPILDALIVKLTALAEPETE